MNRLAPSLLVASLGVAACLAFSGPSALAQDPIQPTPQLDTTQIQQLPGLQSPSSNALILPDSLLQTLRAERITRIGPNQVETDTTTGPGDQDISINAGQVAVLREGSRFRRLPSASAVAGDTVAADTMAADTAGPADPPVYRAPVLLLSNPSIETSAEGDPPSPASPAQGQLLMRSLQDGFVMTERPSIFKTTLQIWLESDAVTGTSSLAAPVETIVSAENAVSVESSPFTFRRFNDVTTVDIRARPRDDSLSVSLQLSAEGSPSRAILGVRRPELSVSANPTQIEGFGLGESTVQVQVPGSYPSPVNLSARTQAATANPASQDISPGTTGEFAIRSWGTGEETIRIEGGPFAEAGRTVRVDFIWPIYFILFALGGSLVGGGIRYYRRRSKGGDRPPLLPGILASGVLIGIVGAVLYGIGVSLFAPIPAGKTGQAVVFVVSAAAAVSGPNLPFEDTTMSG